VTPPFSSARVQRFAAPDGTHLAFHHHGTGTPIICVPGGPMLDSAYLGDLGGLAADRALVLLDLRGTGESERPRDLASYRCDRQVPDLEALREHLGLDRLDLLAHSAGANLVYRYAEAHPDRVARLILIAPSTRGLGIEAPPDSDPGDDSWLDEFSHPEAADAYAAGGAFDPPATRAALARLDVPVVVLAGTLDPGMPVDAMAEVAGLFPRGRLVVQEGAGHFPWVDDPTAFRATLGPHLG
jgi:proline iminopeptidase